MSLSRSRVGIPTARLSYPPSLLRSPWDSLRPSPAMSPLLNLLSLNRNILRRSSPTRFSTRLAPPLERPSFARTDSLLHELGLPRLYRVVYLEFISPCVTQLAVDVASSALLNCFTLTFGPGSSIQIPSSRGIVSQLPISTLCLARRRHPRTLLPCFFMTATAQSHFALSKDSSDRRGTRRVSFCSPCCP